MNCHLSLRVLIACCLSCLVGSTTQGEVIDSSAAGFTVEFEVSINAPPSEVYGHLVNEIDNWWQSRSHIFR